MPAPSADITGLLKAWGRGDRGALDKLTPLVYDQLRHLAAGYMHREPPGHSLQPTALVHEAYLRLVRVGEIRWQDRVHFFAVSARMMRRILVDHARARRAARRGGPFAADTAASAVDPDELPAPDAERADQLCALDDAIDRLAQFDRRRARVVELRFFGGLSVGETAAELDVSPQTVMRDWRIARAWLMREIRDA